MPTGCLNTTLTLAPGGSTAALLDASCLHITQERAKTTSDAGEHGRQGILQHQFREEARLRACTSNDEGTEMCFEGTSPARNTRPRLNKAVALAHQLIQNSVLQLQARDDICRPRFSASRAEQVGHAVLATTITPSDQNTH